MFKVLHLKRQVKKRMPSLLCKHVQLNRENCVQQDIIITYYANLINGVYNVLYHCTTVLFIVPSAMLLCIHHSHNEQFPFLYSLIVV